MLGFEGAPRPGADATQGDAGVLDLVAVQLQHDCRRCESKLIGGAIAQLEIVRLCSGIGWRQRDADDHVARLQNGFAVGSGAGQQIKFVNWNAALALCSLDLNCRLKRGERNVLVGRIGCDAVLAGAEDGERAVVAVDCGAAGAGFALVAGVGGVAEIDAAGALQQIAAGGGHVAKLRRCAGEQSLREHRVVALHGGVVCAHRSCGRALR